MTNIRKFYCPVCTEESLTARDDRVYCSKQCRGRAERRRLAGEPIADPFWYRGPFGDGPPRPKKVPEPVQIDDPIDAEAYGRMLFEDDGE